MKKWLWAIPVAMILVTSVAIGVLNTRDISPENVVAEVDPREIAPMSEAEVLTAIENDPAFAALDYAVLAEDELCRLYVTRGQPEDPQPSAHNNLLYTRDLGNGWTYALEYVCGITFTNQYLSQLEDEVGQPESVVFYLRDKADCAQPGTKSKSAYAVEAHVKTASGEERVAFFDPKTKVLIGWAD